MTVENFKKKLVEDLAERITNYRIELANASIESGVGEYIEKGYITLKSDFDDELISILSSGTFSSIEEAFCSMGLDGHDYRVIADTSEAKMLIAIWEKGWITSLVEIDNVFRHIARLPRSGETNPYLINRKTLGCKCN